MLYSMILTIVYKIKHFLVMHAFTVQIIALAVDIPGRFVSTCTASTVKMLLLDIVGVSLFLKTNAPK